MMTSKNHVVVRPQSPAVRFSHWPHQIPDFMAYVQRRFALLFSSPPSISISLICPLVSLSPLLLSEVNPLPQALIKIASFLALLLSLAFSFKATNEDVGFFFSQEQQNLKKEKDGVKEFLGHYWPLTVSISMFRKRSDVLEIAFYYVKS